MYIRPLRVLAKFTNLIFVYRTKICRFFCVNEFNFTKNPRFLQPDFLRFAGYTPAPAKTPQMTVRREQILHSFASYFSTLCQKTSKIRSGIVKLNCFTKSGADAFRRLLIFRENSPICRQFTRACKCKSLYSE